MAPTPDELAGTVDRFGGLTRSELTGAMADLAARSGADLDPDALETSIDDALEGYYLVELDGPEPDVPLLVAGPAALPRLPAGGEDLPHLLDVEHRSIDHEGAAREVAGRLRRDAETAIVEDDAERAERLLDACYEVEAWGPVDLGDTKAGLGDLLG